MKGEEIVNRVYDLQPREIVALSFLARRGDPPSVLLTVALGLKRRLKKAGATDEQIKASLPGLLDRLSIEVS